MKQGIIKNFNRKHPITFSFQKLVLHFQNDNKVEGFFDFNRLDDLYTLNWWNFFSFETNQLESINGDDIVKIELTRRTWNS